MSAAFKCDRCGDFEESCLLNEPGELHLKNIPEMTNNITCELCSTCKREFRRWYRDVVREAPRQS